MGKAKAPEVLVVPGRTPKLLDLTKLMRRRGVRPGEPAVGLLDGVDDMQPGASGDDWLEVEVTTPRGVAQLKLDMSRERDGVVKLSAVLPSGQTYTAAVEDVDPENVDLSDEGIKSTLRLAAWFVVMCFEHEASEAN